MRIARASRTKGFAGAGGIEIVLPVGSDAPLFEAFNQDGEEVRLAEFRGRKNVVLFFFPKSGTPG